MITQRRAIWMIFASAFFLRAIWTYLYPPVLLADAIDYHQLALSIIKGNGFSDSFGNASAYRPPLYPLFLALVMKLTGSSSLVAIGVFQSFLGVLLVAAIRKLSLNFFDEKTALYAAVLAALYPPFVALPRLVTSENLALPLFAFQFILAFRLLNEDRNDRSTKAALKFGVISAFAVLTRGSALFFVGTSLVTLAYLQRDRAALVIGKISVAIALLLFVLSPWAYRNAKTMNAFVPVSSEVGLTLYSSYWPPERMGRRIWGSVVAPAVVANLISADDLKNEAFESRALTRLTLERLYAEPLHFFKLIPEKLVFLLAPLDWEILSTDVRDLKRFNWAYVAVFPLFALGFLYAIRRREPILVPLSTAAFLALLLQTVIFYGSPRFRLGVEPLFIIFAATALTKLLPTNAVSCIGRDKPIRRETK